MTNFDFLKNFNHELYEIGAKLEEDVINSPRAVTADATLFLETLVKDMYKRSKKKLDSNLISFYKKTDNLYRKGVITYIYKNKLQEAYTLRNKIHKKNLDPVEEKKLAYDLHKRLYYISKKYFRDFSSNQRFIDIPDYKKPTAHEIQFENCIICGNSNKTSLSNMCKTCNQKIENANLMLTLQNTFKNTRFTRQDLIAYGINESHAILLLMDLSKFNAITNKGEYYKFNPENFRQYLDEINQYVEIGVLITRFYKDEIGSDEIKQTEEYKKGKNNQKPYREFYRLVNQKIEKSFENNLLKFRDIDKSIKLSSIGSDDINRWFSNQKEFFKEGCLNESFILYNELLIDQFFRLKRKGFYDRAALKQLGVSDYIYDFWQDHFMGGSFSKKSNIVKKNTIISEIKKNKLLKDALDSAGVSRKEFDKMCILSKDSDGGFYERFEREYTQKRQKLLVKHLKKNNLNRAIRLTKITKSEFLKWYFEGEVICSEFYIKTTELLMKKYIQYRENNWNKRDILRELNITKEMFDSWSNHDDLDLFRNFEDKNEEITSTIVKRGLVINGIKDGKSKEEAIFCANLTPREFVEIYNKSKKEKTEFHSRFDIEYEKSRKRSFVELIQKQDFYNAIQNCEISQNEFNRWYSKDQDMYISTNRPTHFYNTATLELMDKYLKARRAGKNKPDAAKSVGLSNIIVNKWLNHMECNLFYEFKKKIKKLNIDLIVEGFRQAKSKIEVSEIYDIPLKDIDEYIELGRNGFIKYEEISELYENNVVPSHLKIFLNDFKTKTFYKSLKHAKLTKEELDYYYNLGKSGNNNFTEFYNAFIDLKISIYVNTILAKKSVKIALKNSSLTKEEFEANRGMIERMIMDGRVSIIGDVIFKSKTNGVKMAKRIGISVEELYDWYFKGKNGDEKYEAISNILELGMIIPRMVAFNKASDIGMSKKLLIKKLKKDLGPKDFKIWQQHGLVDLDEVKIIIDGKDEVEDATLIEMLEKTDFIKVNKKNIPISNLDGIEVSFTKLDDIDLAKNIIKEEIVGK